MILRESLESSRLRFQSLLTCLKNVGFYENGLRALGSIKQRVFKTICFFSIMGAYCVYAGEIKVGATLTPASEILEFAKPILAKQGVKLVIQPFSDYVLPNMALNDKNLDANLYQHKPFMEKMNKDKNLNLVSLSPIYVVPLGLYSHKYKSIAEIPTHAIIALPNDPTNYSRALILLHDHGLITLKDSSNLNATQKDIQKNPKKLRFKAMDAPILPRALDDVDACVINANFALQAKLSIKDSLVHENEKSIYSNVLVARKDNQNSIDIIKLKEVLLSKEVADFIVKKYKGEVLPSTKN